MQSVTTWIESMLVYEVWRSGYGRSCFLKFPP